MKKILSWILCTIMLFTTLISIAGASDYEAHASAYFKAVDIWAESNGDGTVSFWADVSCNDDMVKIGMSKIVVQQKISGTWQDIATRYGTLNNGMLDTGTISYTGSVTCTVTKGQTYRAIITAYAGDSNGSDTRERTTNAVVA